MTRNLLIIEDNPALGVMLGWELEARGWIVRIARDCREALAAMRRGPYRLVLFDYHLPDGNGLDLFRRLRRLQPGLEGVLMTGDHSVEPAAATGDAGVRGILRKPVWTAQLAAVTDRVLEGRCDPDHPGRAGPADRASG
ncbi:MAG: response regulator [Gammaproteobacteria bacterium]|nr:response regulator [Gammaproteobacteria bacterium]